MSSISLEELISIHINKLEIGNLKSLAFVQSQFGEVSWIYSLKSLAWVRRRGEVSRGPPRLEPPVFYIYIV